MRLSLLMLCVISALPSTAAKADEQQPLADPTVSQPREMSEFAAAPAQPFCFESEPLETQFWGEVEYLMWWMKPVCQKVPLLNAGSPMDASPGTDGQTGTQPILGISKYQMHSPMRST